MTPLVVATVIAVVGLVSTMFAAAADTVAGRLNVVRALRLAEEGRRGAAALLWLTEHKTTSRDAILTLAVLVRVAFVVAAVWVGYELTGTAGGTVAAAVVVAIVWLVLGEIAPRTFAVRHLEAVGLVLGPSARAIVRFLDPVARVAVVLGRTLVPRRDEVSGPYALDDELRQYDADGNQRDERLDSDERAMIRSIFELGDTVVREVMTPRLDMATVARDATLDEVVDVVVECGNSRLPVHEPNDAGTIVGVVHAKDLLQRVADDTRQQQWHDLVRAPFFVPETKRCDEFLRDLQASATHLALVVDEHGELVGLATIEDILEEIVGEIIDEHDQEAPLVEVLEDDRLLVDARLGVDDLNELLDTDLPEEGWDTVGGLVLGTVGRVPTQGETFELEGVCLTVEQVQGRRVAKVVVAKAAGTTTDSSP